jgi:hypothetical protein
MLFVGGYVMARTQAKRLQKEWALQIARPYREMTNGEDFHACDLETHRVNYGRARVNAFERIAQSLITERISAAVGVAFDQEEFMNVAPKEWFGRFGKIYTVCCQLCLDVTGRWADRTNYRGLIRYFFESGHRHARATNACLKSLWAYPELVRAYRFAGHEFLPKRNVFPLQAADYFAWNFTRNWYERFVLGTGMRPSMKALLKRDPSRYDVKFITGDALKRFVEQSYAQEWLNKRGQRIHERKKQREAKRQTAASPSELDEA